MYRLLALILFSICFHAHAAGTFSASVSQESLFQLYEDTKKNTQGVSIQSPQVYKHYTFSAQLLNETQDNSHKSLTQKNGQTIPLSQIDNGNRQILSLSAEYQLASFLTTVSATQDVKESEFSRKQLSLRLQKDFYSGATQVFTQIDTSRQNQPESYFINPSNLKSEKRLSQIQNNTVTLGLEQILTENLRSQIQYSESRLKNFRPLQRTLKTATSIALTSRWTSRIDLGASYESKNESLYDDRGYFRAQWLDSEIAYEFKLDSFVGLGWSTVYEKEEDPRRGYKANLGTDAFGVFLDKKFKRFSTSFKIAQSQTSESQSGLSASGELKWEL